MTVYEMEGFLRGKCVPGDLKVNETNAEYLVRKFAELENKCAALVAENAAFKDINAWCKTDAFKNMYREFKTAEAVGCCNIDCMHDAMLVAIMHAPKAPATDTFLNEIQAQGVDTFGDYLNGLCWDDKDIKMVRDFAAQLRKR